VSAERIREEWLKAMKARRPSRAFEVMRAQGMLAVTAPELLEAVGCEQNKHHAYDVWQHVLACVDACRTDPILRMAALLHDLGKPRSRAYSDKTDDYTFYEHERIGAELAGPLLERLRFSNDERERIVGLVRHHLVCYDPSWSDAAVRRWIRRVTPELLDDVLSLNRADVRAKGRDASEDLARIDALEQRVAEVLAQGAALSVRDLAIDGRTLMQGLELSPGPVVGELLRELLERVVESPELNQRETLLELSRALLRDRANGSRSPA
jgi:tRNA nucleotidyltransferase (CCA-adding enzyme)